MSTEEPLQYRDFYDCGFNGVFYRVMQTMCKGGKEQTINKARSGEKKTITLQFLYYQGCKIMLTITKSSKKQIINKHLSTLHIRYTLVLLSTTYHKYWG
jgi:hypothetical protein